MVTRSRKVLYAGAAALGVCALALSGSPASAAVPRATISINGAGSTFIDPIMSGSWIPGYQAKHSNVQINYNAIGSGSGISLWSGGKVDFAGSDALLNAVQQAKAKNQCAGGVAKLPATIGAVALIYNLPGVKTGLKLTPGVIAQIFLGDITKWNDAQIKRVNPGVNLPDLAIQTVHRADGSGTTYIFTHYLSDVSSVWVSRLGGAGSAAGSLINWPNGTGAQKSSGMAAAIGTAPNGTPGAIGYVDLAFAISGNLTYASIQNKAGKFVAPSSASASVAADSFAPSMPRDLAQLIVNSSNPKAYAITGYSYLFLCTHQSSAKGRTLVDFVRYVVTTGQSAATKLYYAPLPKSVQNKDLDVLNSLR